MLINEDPGKPTAGLCGNFDGDPSNDFMDADGNDVSDDPAKYRLFSERFVIESL